MLTFDPTAHQYGWNGVIVPSVTEIIGAALGDAFQNTPAAVLDYARQRGQAVHRACELDSAGSLNEASVAPEIMPYLAAWREFRRLYPFNVVRAEFPMYHGGHGYAGTPDIIFETPFCWGVIDIKTGATGIRAHMQTAAYLDLARLQFSAIEGKPARRFALQLRPNGRPSIVEHTANAADWRDFLSCLNVYRLKMREQMQ